VGLPDDGWLTIIYAFLCGGITVDWQFFQFAPLLKTQTSQKFLYVRGILVGIL